MRCKHPPGVHIFNRIKQVAKRIANIRFARDNRGTAMYRIMIVEDDEIIASSIKKHLEKWNYDVFVVNDFENVLEDFRNYEPLLILLDISLPYYNGYYWCQEIRKESEVPIIFISSTSENMNIVMAMNMGADDFINKPFDLTVLTAKSKGNT